MTQLQHGDKYQVVWNGSQFVVVWTDAVALQSGDVVAIGVNPSSGAGSGTITGSLSGMLADSGMSSAGQIGVGGLVSAATDASMSNSAQVGQQGNVVTVIENIVQALLGNAGLSGILSASSYVNLAPTPSAFDTWMMDFCTVSANVALAPDGTMTADKLIPTADAQQHRVKYGTFYTTEKNVNFSVFLKAAEYGTTAMILAWNATDGIWLQARVNLFTGVLSGVIGANSAISNEGSGWYRVSAGATYTVASNANAYFVYPMEAATAGNGVSGVLAWGAQITHGLDLKPYVKILSTDSNLIVSGRNGFNSVFNAPGGNSIVSMAAREGVAGVLQSGISLSTLLYGSLAGETGVCEGTLSAVLDAFQSSISALLGATGNLSTITDHSAAWAGNTGVAGQLADQIANIFALTGRLGISGNYSINLDNLAAMLSGACGVSGSISATLSSGTELIGKLGVSGDLQSAIDDLGLQLIQIIVSDRIYNIVISTKTGQALFSTKTGNINITLN